MTRFPQCFCQLLCQRHVSQPAAFRDRDVPFPFRTRNAQLTLVQRLSHRGHRLALRRVEPAGVRLAVNPESSP